MTTVERISLAPGLTVSRLLTGLWQIADLERDGAPLDPEATADAMQPYVAAGLDCFDVADHYGSAEVITGAFRRKYADRSPIQVLTKWVPEPGVVTKDSVRAAVERALERTAADRIDLLQFHTWNYADLSYLDALEYLQRLSEEGLIGQLGLTNFDTAHLRVVLQSGVPIVSNQVSFSLLDRRAAGRMSELCLEHGVRLLAYGTLAGGLLTERFVDAPEPALEGSETWSHSKYLRFVHAAGGWGVVSRLLTTLSRIARAREVSVANVATRAILQEPAVGAVIVGARLGRSEHVEDNLRLFQFELDDAELAAIDEALGGANAIPGDCGDEYRRPPFLTASGDLSHHLEGFPAAYDSHDLGGGRSRVLSGTRWERVAGYCRATRIGDRILVSGTTATHGDRAIGGADAEAQAHFIIDKLEAAIVSLGGKLEDIVRTRIYLANLGDTEAVSRAHGQRFAQILPANTLVGARLVGEENLVEIEAEAVVPARTS